jgi:hypothetical protein
MYVEGENDVRTKLVGFFSRWKNSTGDLALWWEVAHERRLGRHYTCSDVAAHKDPCDEKGLGFPVGGDLVNPRYWCSPL